jgi:hypothetical protein
MFSVQVLHVLMWLLSDLTAFCVIAAILVGESSTTSIRLVLRRRAGGSDTAPAPAPTPTPTPEPGPIADQPELELNDSDKGAEPVGLQKKHTRNTQAQNKQHEQTNTTSERNNTYRNTNTSDNALARHMVAHLCSTCIGCADPKYLMVVLGVHPLRLLSSILDTV